LASESAGSGFESLAAHSQQVPDLHTCDRQDPLSVACGRSGARTVLAGGYRDSVKSAGHHDHRVRGPSGRARCSNGARSAKAPNPARSRQTASTSLRSQASPAAAPGGCSGSPRCSPTPPVCFGRPRVTGGPSTRPTSRSPAAGGTCTCGVPELCHRVDVGVHAAGPYWLRGLPSTVRV
jgi:hypothetical protein